MTAMTEELAALADHLIDIINAEGLIIIQTVWATTPDRRRGYRLQKSEQTGTGFRSKAAGDFGGKRHLISLQSDIRFRRFRHP